MTIMYHTLIRQVTTGVSITNMLVQEPPYVIKFDELVISSRLSLLAP